jgi:predicted transposase/invertase (TIGR01784 family)
MKSTNSEHTEPPVIGEEFYVKAREHIARGEILNPLSDFVFKAIFSKDDEDSREALRSLLTACVGRQIRSVQLRNQTIPAERLGSKTIILDVHVTFNDGEQADLEMQVEKTDDDIKNRAVFYGAKLIVNQELSGSPYREMKRVYVIYFLNCVLFSGSEKVPRCYSLREKSEQDELTDTFEILFFEMPKLERQVKDWLEGKRDFKNLSLAQKWCIFFRYRKDGTAGELIKELCRQEEGIMRAEQVLEQESLKEENWAVALFREKAEMDYWSGLANARDKGIVIGEERGRAKAYLEKLESARKMKNDGFSDEQIAKYSGLSSEELEKL